MQDWHNWSLRFWSILHSQAARFKHAPAATGRPPANCLKRELEPYRKGPVLQPEPRQNPYLN